MDFHKTTMTRWDVCSLHISVNFKGTNGWILMGRGKKKIRHILVSGFYALCLIMVNYGWFKFGGFVSLMPDLA